MQAEVFHLAADKPAEIKQCLWHDGSLQVLPLAFSWGEYNAWGSAVVAVVVSSAHQQCPVAPFRPPWKLGEKQVKWTCLLENRGAILILRLWLSYIKALQSHLCRSLVQFAVQHYSHLWGRCWGAGSKVEVIEMFLHWSLESIAVTSHVGCLQLVQSSHCIIGCS